MYNISFISEFPDLATFLHFSSGFIIGSIFLFLAVTPSLTKYYKIRERSLADADLALERHVIAMRSLVNNKETPDIVLSAALTLSSVVRDSECLEAIVLRLEKRSRFDEVISPASVFQARLTEALEGLRTTNPEIIRDFETAVASGLEYAACRYPHMRIDRPWKSERLDIQTSNIWTDARELGISRLPTARSFC